MKALFMTIFAIAILTALHAVWIWLTSTEMHMPEWQIVMNSVAVLALLRSYEDRT